MLEGKHNYETIQETEILAKAAQVYETTLAVWQGFDRLALTAQFGYGMDRERSRPHLTVSAHACCV